VSSARTQKASKGAASDATTMITVSISEISRQLREAFQAGMAEGRHLLQASEQVVKAREDSIFKRDELAMTLYGRVDELTKQVGSLAQKTAELAVIDAQKQIALQRAQGRADAEKEAFSLVKEILPDLRGAIGLLGAGAKAARPPEKVRAALETLLGDDELCSALTTRVGVDAFSEFCDWAGAL
jgi:hypothetical protein